MTTTEIRQRTVSYILADIAETRDILGDFQIAQLRRDAYAAEIRQLESEIESLQDKNFAVLTGQTDPWGH